MQCEQFKLAKIFLAKLQREASATVLFDHDVTGVAHTADGVTVTASTPDGKKTFEGEWLIGADGGRSVVRKSVGIGFEGFTWPERFLAVSYTHLRAHET